MTVRLFRKKPVVIEAMQWMGNNTREALAFITCEFSMGPDDAFLQSVFIPTLEGEMEAKPGDWIIKGVAGEFYPCKPDIFAATYEPVVDVGHGFVGEAAHVVDEPLPFGEV